MRYRCVRLKPSRAAIQNVRSVRPLFARHLRLLPGRSGKCALAGERLFPVLPNRIETLFPQNRGDSVGWPVVANLKLTCGQLILAILKFRRNDSTAHGLMEVLDTAASVSPRLGMTAGAHHRYA